MCGRFTLRTPPSNLAQLFLFEDQKQSYDNYQRIKGEVMPLWPAAEQEKGKPKVITAAEARKELLL